jgi:hypothetical protein
LNLVRRHMPQNPIQQNEQMSRDPPKLLYFQSKDSSNAVHHSMKEAMHAKLPRQGPHAEQGVKEVRRRWGCNVSNVK